MQLKRANRTAKQIGFVTFALLGAALAEAMRSNVGFTPDTIPDSDVEVAYISALPTVIPTETTADDMRQQLKYAALNTSIMNFVASIAAAIQDVADLPKETEPTSTLFIFSPPGRRPTFIQGRSEACMETKSLRMDFVIVLSCGQNTHAGRVYAVHPGRVKREAPENGDARITCVVRYGETQPMGVPVVRKKRASAASAPAPQPTITEARAL